MTLCFVIDGSAAQTVSVIECMNATECDSYSRAVFPSAAK